MIFAKNYNDPTQNSENLMKSSIVPLSFGYSTTSLARWTGGFDHRGSGAAHSGDRSCGLRLL